MLLDNQITHTALVGVKLVANCASKYYNTNSLSSLYLSLIFWVRRQREFVVGVLRALNADSSGVSWEVGNENERDRTDKLNSQKWEPPTKRNALRSADTKCCVASERNDIQSLQNSRRQHHRQVNDVASKACSLPNCYTQVMTATIARRMIRDNWQEEIKFMFWKCEYGYCHS